MAFENFLVSHWQRVLSGSFKAENLVDLLQARVAAALRLISDNLSERQQAETFFRGTAIKQDMDLSADIAWIERMEAVDNLEIMCSRDDAELSAVVCKLHYRSKEEPAVVKIFHEIAFFKGGLFSHRYDLSALAQAAKPLDILLIRQIGLDPVLHRQAKIVTNFASAAVKQEMQRQIDLMTPTLYTTGGVGIAANQCAEIEEPWSIILSGVNYAEPEHVARALTRYPNTLFPPMQIYVNPRVIAEKGRVDFAEGCLSLQGPNRAQVARAESVTIEYQDLVGNTHQVELSGPNARVMQHEIDHIQNGKVYFQHTLEELSVGQLESLQAVVQRAMDQNENMGTIPSPFATPVRLFERASDTGELVFEPEKVFTLFKTLPLITLQGVQHCIQETLTEKQTHAHVATLAL